MSVFVIYAQGRRHAYATRAKALEVAAEIFDRTGIVVGITKESE